jgi:hypothetical protein
MAEREMSGKALLDKLYNGLDTMPAAEAERDFRRLTDDFLGKPVEPTASNQRPAPATRAASKPPRRASRAKSLRAPIAVLFSVAVVGVIVAATLRDSDTRVAAVPPPPPAVVPVEAPPPPVQAAEAPPPEPVVLVNPFDKTEKFTFPPGTSKADARDQMAAMLLQRAVERGANRPKSRKLAAEPKARSTAHGS